MDVWWAGSNAAHEGLLPLLDPVERGRHEATVRPADRARFLVGCALSRLVLGELLGLPPARVPLRRVCPRCGGPHGKPRLDTPGSAGPYDFSVTHSGEIIGVAVCRGAEVGLDVEEADGPVDVALAARTALAAPELAALNALPPADRKAAFLRTWTRKEAVLKALGVGLALPLRDLRLSPPDTRPTVLSWPDGLPSPPPATTITDLVAETPATGPHPAAVAVIGHPGTRLAVRTQHVEERRLLSAPRAHRA
ncbi:4'-phosphopantetheinyl transferase family protein [Streptomyces antibioticus]|uniref:4'-phosphopantetheinyl transferase family protein n=1 Tax=Streptomyces antibioticus TaxID=1890 RepID=UPI002256FDA1|nr:4'-phosphopantetheinyl transferase superfamily protein [Streptomyces antibioticus]MCX5169129.1 4'-phosphopantetheinyl transferase superfamily protein [Streptomyces antibioticus]